MARRMMCLAGLVAAGAIALSGCNGASAPPGPTTAAAPQADGQQAKKIPSAAEIHAKAMEQLRSAESVRIAVTSVSGGQELKFDIAGNRAGTNQRMQTTLDGGSGEIITVDGKEYVKGDEKFWTQQGVAPADKPPADKFVMNEAPSVSKESNVGRILEDASQIGLALAGKLNTKVQEEAVDGTPAYRITSRDATADTAMWVSADDRLQLLRMKGTVDQAAATPGQSSTKELIDRRFSDWNAVAPVSAPPADQLLTS